MGKIDDIHEKIASELVEFGGHLECGACGHVEDLGDIGSHLASGWPKHCGYTMTWKTAQQLAQ